MNREWWMPIIQWALWALVMVVVMSWVARSRLRNRPESERNILRHPVNSTLVIGGAGAVFFFGIAIISNTIGKNPTATVWTTLLFVGFGISSVPLIADYFFARHRVSDQGIEYGRMFGRGGSLRWSEVRGVRFSPAMKWFVLEAATGERVRVSAMLVGLPEFARLVVVHVSQEAIEPATRVVLSETEQGRPPSVWG